MANDDEAAAFQDPANGTAGLEPSANDETSDDQPVGRLAFPVAGCGVIYEDESPTEYIEDQSLYPIPTTHALLHGLINRRGSLVPVFDIRTLIDADWEPPVDRTRMLVLGSGDDAVGILLDAIPYRVHLTPDNMVQPPSFLSSAFGRHVRQSFHENDTYYVTVHLGDFLYDLRSEAPSP